MRGRDIKRYGYEWADLWLINTHNGIKGKTPPIDINDYPAVKQHLDRYWDKISKRDDKGVTPYNLRNCGYLDDFFKPKIVYMEIQTDNPDAGYPFPCYSYDESNSIVLNTAYVLTSNNIDVRYILGVLNSSTGKILTKLYVTQLQERQFRMLAQYVCRFPSPLASQSVKNDIIRLVEMRIKGNLDSETAINDMVFSLFGFSIDEINYIENRSN